MNAFASTYANPMAGGMSTGSNTGSSGGVSTAFGQPMYATLVSTPQQIVGKTSSLGGGFIGSSGGSFGSTSSRGRTGTTGMGGYGSSSTGGFGSTGTGGSYGVFVLPNNQIVATAPAAAPATAGPRASVGLPGTNTPVVKLSPLPPRLQGDLKDLIGRADRISPATRNAVTFGLDGGTVVLRGTAANQADARALETLLRFAPGVSALRNEMTWK
jgi:hypothetical protein